ncbi:MAG: DUF4837 family protein [Candidatus Tenebribacter burtonii]|jgi:hypothetical protein|nr:DUF4837 family protein [Candidatus Tenebribacter burtonii]
MKIMNIKIVFLGIILFLILGCSQKENIHKTKSKGIDPHKPMSWGHKQTVYVFADDNVWKYAKGHLLKTLERVRFTTENEKVFVVKRAPIDNLDNFYKFNNLIFFCNLESNDKVSAYIKEIMGSKVESEVNDNLIGMYAKDNVWANDQFVLFILGSNEPNLLKFNILQSHKIFDLFKEKLFDRISGQLYKTSVYSDDRFTAFQWTLKLPKKYVLYKNDTANNFILFIARLRNKSDRYISVYFQKIPKEEFNRNWLRETRQNISWKYYDEDEYFDKDVRMEKYKLAGFQGWRLTGRWQNKKYSVGGAFQSFAIYDEVNGLAYLIDNSVYYPDGEKLEALYELEIISKTFKLKDSEQGDLK